MATPLVTAPIDTYNNGRYVEDAINSALEQNFPASDLEVLIIETDPPMTPPHGRLAKL